MTRKTPTYSLVEIQVAAKSGNIALQGRSETDARNLGYSDEEIAKCLCSLQPSDYIGTSIYKAPKGDVSKPLDEYGTKHITPDGREDELYIKLKLFNWVLVASFHLRRK